MNSSTPGAGTDGTGDFSHWCRELEGWHADISRWQGDHQAALVELDHIERMVIQHGQALREYATDLQAHLQNLSVPNRGAGATETWSPSIESLTLRHVWLRDVHERIRRHHDNATAQLGALVEALDAAI